MQNSGNLYSVRVAVIASAELSLTSLRATQHIHLRKDWNADFIPYLRELDSHKPVIWTGELSRRSFSACELKPSPTNRRLQRGER